MIVKTIKAIVKLFWTINTSLCYDIYYLGNISNKPLIILKLNYLIETFNNTRILTSTVIFNDFFKVFSLNEASHHRWVIRGHYVITICFHLRATVIYESKRIPSLQIVSFIKFYLLSNSAKYIVLYYYNDSNAFMFINTQICNVRHIK